MSVLVAQSCPTPCSPMDCSPPGSSFHGTLQARILEWVTIPFSVQRVFLAQGSKLGLLRCRKILHHLNHQGCIILYLCMLELFHNVFC